jgi:hypothetical protein
MKDVLSAAMLVREALRPAAAVERLVTGNMDTRDDSTP